MESIMMIKKNKTYAVLTGDIIKSSKLSVKEHRNVLDTLERIVQQLPKIHLFLAKEKIKWIGPVIFQGDTWQVLTNLPQYGLLTAFYIKACLMYERSASTRISIGIGTVENLPEDNLSQARGDAFTYSGHGLSLLKGSEPMSCWFVEPIKQPIRKKIGDEDYQNLFLNASLLFAGRTAGEWSELEAFVVSCTIQGMKQDEIASHWPEGATTQQNVGKTLRRAKWIETEKVLNLYQRYIAEKQSI